MKPLKNHLWQLCPRYLPTTSNVNINPASKRHTPAYYFSHLRVHSQNLPPHISYFNFGVLSNVSLILTHLSPHPHSTTNVLRHNSSTSLQTTLPAYFQHVIHRPALNHHKLPSSHIQPSSSCQHKVRLDPQYSNITHQSQRVMSTWLAAFPLKSYPWVVQLILFHFTYINHYPLLLFNSILAFYCLSPYFNWV